MFPEIPILTSNRRISKILKWRGVSEAKVFNGRCKVKLAYRERWGFKPSGRWRCGGLVVSTLDFQSEGQWFEPALCGCFVSLDKKLYSTLSLFTQVYKCVLFLDKKLYSTLSLFTQVYKSVPAIILLGDG